MRLPGWFAVCVLPFVLTGCFHRSRPAQTQSLAPPVNNQPAPAPEPALGRLESTPAPVAQEPEKPAENSPAQNAQQTAETPKPPVHHKKPVNPHPQMASIPGNGVSAIGQLSSGNPGDYRRQTEEQIAADERSLRSISRSLSDQDQRTVAHIRDFLKQARQALASGDVDGAHTLASKAKVLLAELNR